jgi:hypothetical protein
MEKLPAARREHRKPIRRNREGIRSAAAWTLQPVVKVRSEKNHPSGAKAPLIFQYVCTG